MIFKVGRKSLSPHIQQLLIQDSCATQMGQLKRFGEGSSGDGSYFTATFDDVNKVFNAKTKLIDQASSVVSSPYEQSIGVADDGSLHLCWGYRAQSSSANTNFGMFYAKSLDKGHLASASGANTYALP